MYLIYVDLMFLFIDSERIKKVADRCDLFPSSVGPCYFIIGIDLSCHHKK
jgi:hypothetical protein